MDIHQNARTTPASRAELVARVLDDQLPLSLVAAAAGVCPRTVRKWIARYQAESLDGLADRSSRPHRQPRVGHTGSHRRPHHGVAEREWSTRDPRCRSHPTAPRAVLTPLYVKTRVLSGLGDGLACAEGCHDALGDLSRKEAFQASDDLAFGPAIGGAGRWSSRTRPGSGTRRRASRRRRPNESGQGDRRRGSTDVLQLSKSGKRAIGRVGRAPSHAATSNKLLMN